MSSVLGRNNVSCGVDFDLLAIIYPGLMLHSQMSQELLFKLEATSHQVPTHSPSPATASPTDITEITILHLGASVSSGEVVWINLIASTVSSVMSLNKSMVDNSGGRVTV